MCGVNRFFNGARCTPIRQCNNRQFISANATATSDAICSFQRQCAPFEFETTPPTEYTNRECATRTACDRNTMYIAQDATQTSDTVFMPIAVCQPGTKQTSPNGARKDTTCEPCEAGEFSSSSGLKNCKPFIVCSPEQFISVEGTPSSDRQCAHFTTCSLLHYEVSAPVPRISNRVCANATRCNATEYETAALTATTNRVCATAISCVSGFGYTFADMLSCMVVVGDRGIFQSSATNLTNPVLTRAEGYLDINTNNMLTRIDFASLSYVGGFLQIAGNSALTFASLPRLSQVQQQIYICQNAPSFVIPNFASGTAAPPGLTSVRFKGQFMCFLQQVSETCNLVNCP
jgi:hypothetical protein